MKWEIDFDCLSLKDSNHDLLAAIICKKIIQDNVIYLYKVDEVGILNYNDIVELLGEFAGIDGLKTKIETYYRLHGYS